MNNLVECPNCGEINVEESVYCQECGNQLNAANSSVSTNKAKRKPMSIKTSSKSEVKDPKKKLINELTIALIFWGILNLFFAPIGGIILILFAIIIYASQKLMAIYALAVIWLIIAGLQALLGLWYMDSVYTSDVESGTYLLFASLINMIFGGIIIYRTRKVEEKISQS